MKEKLVSRKTGIAFAGKQAGTISNAELRESMDKRYVTDSYSLLLMSTMEKVKWPFFIGRKTEEQDVSLTEEQDFNLKATNFKSGKRKSVLLKVQLTWCKNYWNQELSEAVIRITCFYILIKYQFNIFSVPSHVRF